MKSSLKIPESLNKLHFVILSPFFSWIIGYQPCWYLVLKIKLKFHSGILYPFLGSSKPFIMGLSVFTNSWMLLAEFRLLSWSLNCRSSLKIFFKCLSWKYDQFFTLCRVNNGFVFLCFEGQKVKLTVVFYFVDFLPILNKFARIHIFDLKKGRWSIPFYDLFFLW